MLSLTIAPGDYVTIGDNIVLQFDHMGAGSCDLMIQAPPGDSHSAGRGFGTQRREAARLRV